MTPRTHLFVHIGVVIFFSALVLWLTSCAPSVAEQTRDEQKTVVEAKERKQVVQAVSNLEPIGDHLQASGRKPEGKAVNSQAAIIEKALDIKAEEKALPTVSFNEWQQAKDSAAQAESLAARLSEEKTTLNKSLDLERAKLADLEKKVEEENNSMWSWAKVGGFAVSALGAASYLAQLLGVPGASLISSATSMICPMLQRKAQEAEQKAKVASTAVIASDAGSFALSQLEMVLKRLDPALAARIPELIGKATGGQTDSIQGVFKMVAKGVATDEGMQSDVNKLLTVLRDEMPTRMGQHTAAVDLFKAA